MSSWDLTVGAIQGIMADEAFDRPVLQVLGQKLIGTSPDRYRLLLSDGRHMHSAALLATQLSGLVTSDRLNTNAVIRLDKYICNAMQPGNKRIMILLELTVLGTGSEVGAKIGNPQTLKPNAGDRNVTSTAANVTTSNFDNKEEIGPNFSCTATQLDSISTNDSRLSFAKEATPQSSEAKKSPIKVYPISCLTPYQNRWTIKARVTHKSSIRHWKNSRGEGTIFDMTLLDESGEIRATAFNVVEKFYSLIEVNKVYYIRKADLKLANKDYSTTNNDYDMAFTGETEVIPCDDGDDLPTNTFNFVAINLLESRNANDTIDVIGIVKEVDDVKMVVARQTGKELKKRDITLVDDSKVEVCLTLWENDAEMFDGNGNPVLAIKSCCVSTWGGRSLTARKTSQIILNPDIQESHRLRAWFDSVGRSLDYVEYKLEGGVGTGKSGVGKLGTNWKNLAEIKAQNLGCDKAEYFTVKATFVFFQKENCLYHACPQQDCNKKLIDQENCNYYCEKCKKNYPNFKWGIGLRANLADFSDSQWITCFQDTAEAVLGKSADELAHLKDVDDSTFGHVFSEAVFKSFIFRLRSKMGTFNNESRLKTVCMQATSINYVDYNRKLISDIESLLGPALV